MRTGILFASVALHAAAMVGAVAVGAYATRRLPQPPPRVLVTNSLPSAPAAAATPHEPDVVVEASADVPDVVETSLERPFVHEDVAVAVERVVLDRAPTRDRVLADEAAATPAPTTTEARPFVDAEPVADNPPPQYPEHERRAGHEGTVGIVVAVDAAGCVVGAELRSPCAHAGLNREALRAVRGWRFEPARREGRPVASETEVTVEFRLRDGAR